MATAVTVIQNAMMENLVFTVFILVCKHLLRLIVDIDGVFTFASVYLCRRRCCCRHRRIVHSYIVSRIKVVADRVYII